MDLNEILGQFQGKEIKLITGSFDPAESSYERPVTYNSPGFTITFTDGTSINAGLEQKENPQTSRPYITIRITFWDNK